VSLRVVLVIRRFWPMVGGAEVLLSRLAAGLQVRGATVTVLTPKWQPDWPAEIEDHGFRVVRLPPPSGSGWGALRYMQRLAQWLHQHREQFDVVCVSTLRQDAYAVLTAARKDGFPVVLRAERAGGAGDCHWQLEAYCGQRLKRRCNKAAAIIAPSPAVERELIAAGYPRERIHSVSKGVAIPTGPVVQRTADHDDPQQIEAREALAEADPALMLPSHSPLAVYVGPLAQHKGLEHLVAAWPKVLSRWPNARLWLVGEGPMRGRLLGQIDERSLIGRVVLSGVFDDVEDMLRAADLFVLPSLDEDLSLALLEAMAQGLPVVASDLPGNRTVITDAVHGRLTPPGDTNALSAAILEMFDKPELASRLGEQARQRVAIDFSLDQMVDHHLQVFSEVCGIPKSEVGVQNEVQVRGP
jgi:glycosyltransferase involved in cell wall biosynthesis